MTARFGATLSPAGVRIGGEAVAMASNALAARVAAAAPEIVVTTNDGMVRLSSPGLVARVFGSRRRGPDPQLIGIVGGGR